MEIRLEPEQADALWSLLDAEYIDSICCERLTRRIMEHPDYVYYEGDDIDEASDQAFRSVIDQINGQEGSGSFIMELSGNEVEFLKDSHQNLYGRVRRPQQTQQSLNETWSAPAGSGN